MALNTAADKYGIPRNLMYGVAWQESKWHEDIVTCDQGIGLMQVETYTYPWLNGLSQPGCDVALNSGDTYDPYTLQGNAYLGAKYLAWLKCLYEYNSPQGGSTGHPVNGSSAYIYQQAALQYPDTKTSGGASLGPCSTSSATPGAGTPTPSPTPLYGKCSLCLTLFQHNINGPTDTLYQDLPASSVTPWACPFDATKGVSDYELVDLVLSAYNEGPGNLSKYGVLNGAYLYNVETWTTRFATGALPIAS